MKFMNQTAVRQVPWNKGKLIGQKAPLKLREIWAIRVRLLLRGAARELALFNLAINSKLRSCDLLNLRLRDICNADGVAARATVLQQNTHRPVRVEITEQARDSLMAWIQQAALVPADNLFPSRIRGSDHLSTRQYSRIVHFSCRALCEFRSAKVADRPEAAS